MRKLFKKYCSTIQMPNIRIFYTSQTIFNVEFCQILHNIIFQQNFVAEILTRFTWTYTAWNSYIPHTFCCRSIQKHTAPLVAHETKLFFLFSNFFNIVTTKPFRRRIPEFYVLWILIRGKWIFLYIFFFNSLNSPLRLVLLNSFHSQFCFDVKLQNYFLKFL